jgi:hypothetical protein
MSQFALEATAYLMACCFLFVGLVGAARWAEQNGADRTDAMCFATIYLGTAALIIFFAYLPGKVPGLLVTGSGVAFSFWLVHRTRGRAMCDIRPFFIAALFGLCYISLEHIYVPPDMTGVPGQVFFEQTRPDDDWIPFNFARAVLENLPSRTGIDSTGWYFSDRPPLQTGFTLAFAPLREILPFESVYRAVGTLLQVSALAAVSLFCQAIGFSRKETDSCVIALGCSGFVFYNSVYCWPKLLAAAFCLIGIIPLARALVKNARITLADGILTGSSFALAMLSHGGVGFTFVTMAVLAPVLLWRKTLSTRGIAAGALVFVALLSPWQIYSTFVDPNDGKLIKMHLSAGPWDGKEKPSLMLSKSYSEISFDRWLSNRWQNLLTLFGNDELDGATLATAKGVGGDNKGAVPSYPGDSALNGQSLKYDAISMAMLLRVDQREHVMRALGLWALALPLVLLAIAFTRWRRRIGSAILGLGVFILVNVAVWICLEFSAGYAVITHASLAMIVLAFVFLVSATSRLSRTLSTILLTLNGLASVLVWAIIMPGTLLLPKSEIQPAPVLMAAISATLLAVVFLRRSAGCVNDQVVAKSR